MTTINVANADELNQALSTAQGGDTIVLKSGDYGALTLSGVNFTSDVTIKSETGTGAVFDKMVIANSSNIVFDSIEVANPATTDRDFVRINGSSGISIVNSEIHGSVDGNNTYNPAWQIGGHALDVSGCTDITISNNYVHDSEFGTVFSHTTGLTVSGNKYDQLGADSMQFNDVTDVVIENNTAAPNIIASTQEHTDFIQFYGSGTNVVISGNTMLPQTLTFVEYPLAPGVADGGHNRYYQGMLLKGGTFTNVTIENNLIYTNTVNGIVVRNNTVLTLPGHAAAGDLTPDGSLYGTTEIRLINVDPASVTIENNVANKIWLDSNTDTDANPSFPFSPNEAYVGNNLIILPAQYADYFAHAPQGLGASASDFTLADGNLAVTKGAFQLIQWSAALDTDDTLTGDAHDNTIRGGGGNDCLYGNAGDDHLLGGNGDDRLYGGYGNDYLSGNAGDDKLYGNRGDDSLHDGGGNDYLSGGYGNDNLYGGSGDDKLYGQTGNDVIHGNTGNDFIAGGSGNDLLYGDAGNDTIYGGDGNDVIHGGTGKDQLYGDAGADTFVFDKMDAGNVDVIHDLSVGGGDKIDIHALLASNFGDTSKLGDFVHFSASHNVVTMSVDSNGGANHFVAVATFEVSSWSDHVKEELYKALITH